MRSVRKMAGDGSGEPRERGSGWYVGAFLHGGTSLATRETSTSGWNYPMVPGSRWSAANCSTLNWMLNARAAAVRFVPLKLEEVVNHHQD